MIVVCFCGRTYASTVPVCTNRKCRAYGQSLPHDHPRPQG